MTNRPLRPERLGRRPRNPAEAQCWEHLRALGWTPTKRGWPDFFAFDDEGRVLAVEVKRFPQSRLKRTQARILLALHRAGLPVFVFEPSNGLRALTEDELLSYHPPQGGGAGRG